MPRLIPKKRAEYVRATRTIEHPMGNKPSVIRGMVISRDDPRVTYHADAFEPIETVVRGDGPGRDAPFAVSQSWLSPSMANRSCPAWCSA